MGRSPTDLSVWRVAEQASLSTMRVGGGDSEVGHAIYVFRIRGLDLPVVHVILNDAQGVDPERLNTE